MTDLSRRALIGAAGLATLAALTGCSRPNERSPSTSPAPEGSPDMSTTPAPTGGSNLLLVYFSRAGENYWEGGRRDLDVGNTKRLAEMIAARVDCDVHELVAADPYREAYDPTVERNQREQNLFARPGIAGQLPDLSGHGTVLLGSPVWNTRAPMIMSTFIEGVDLTGRTVLPFVTYAVSGRSGVDEDYRAELTGATVADGLAVRGEEVDDAATAVDAWLRENQLL